MKKFLVLTSLIVFLLSGVIVSNSADASVVYAYATDVIWDVGGNGNTDPARSGFNNSLGAPDSNFLSLGTGGKAVYEFPTQFDSPAYIYETTINRATFPESADVYAIDSTYQAEFATQKALGFGNASISTTGFTFLDSITNNSDPSQINFLSGPFSYLLILDTSPVPQGTFRDGFDVNSVYVKSVPIPPAVLLLGSGIIGLVGIRRKLRQN